MANANATAEKIKTPKIDTVVKGRNRKGVYVERTTFTNGDIREDFLCQNDAPEDVKFLDAAKTSTVKDVRPLPKKKGS